jgi:hypothetical protein
MVLLGVAVLPGIASFVLRSRTRITLEEEAHRLETLLPDGTPEPRVEVVLDSLHIDHSRYDPARHQVAGIDRHTTRSPLTDTSLRVELRLDSQGRLISRAVREVHTGP